MNFEWNMARYYLTHMNHMVETWLAQDPITHTPCDVEAEKGTDLDVWSAPFSLVLNQLCILLPFLFSPSGNLLFNRWNGSSCIYTHTRIACPVTILFLFCFCLLPLFASTTTLWIACLTIFLFSFTCSFPSCYLFVHKLLSACHIRFLPGLLLLLFFSKLTLQNWRFIVVQFRLSFSDECYFKNKEQVRS